MVISVPATLLSDANREVQAADHILSAVYPLSRDPKVLLGALEHERRALELATSVLPGTAEAVDALARIESALAAYARSHTVFTRGEKRVIADDDFTNVTHIDPASVARDLDAIKRFVHEANKRVALGKVE